MNLNDMELPASLLTGLYKTHLVEEATPVKKETAPVAKLSKSATEGIQYLGKNQKGVCILVNYPKDVYLPDEQLNFLTAILQACKLNLGDVAIVNHSRHKVSFEELRRQLGCRQLLLFGVAPAATGLPEMELFTLNEADGCGLLASPAAEQLNSNTAESKQLKSRLWLCLKQLFNV